MIVAGDANYKREVSKSNPVRSPLMVLASLLRKILHLRKYRVTIFAMEKKY
jgi:hypothetical protein